MKAEVKVFTVLVPFFLIVTVIYGYFTRLTEWVGVLGLFLTAVFSAWIAVYLWLQGRRTDPRPEDNLQGEIADAAGEYGHFTPYSWWPLWVGLSVSVLVLGLGIGWWLFIVAAPFVVLSVIGWSLEHFRGADAI